MKVIFWFHSSSKNEFKKRIMELEKIIHGGINVLLLPWEQLGAGFGEFAYYEAILKRAPGPMPVSPGVDEIVEKLLEEGCEVIYYPCSAEQKQGFIIKEKKEV